MDLMDQYVASIQRGEITDDQQQRAIIPVLQATADSLRIVRPWYLFTGRKPAVTGVYICGPVGAGKTYLMDLLYSCVEIKKKKRFHWHQFMQYIDAQLRLRQGQRDPVKSIAQKISKNVKLLCLDEFLVNDVADASILALLLQTLFARGVVLVITSNTQIDGLYAHGIHRDQFLPAIALLKQHCTAVWLNDGHDYRLGRASIHQKYLYPLNSSVQASLVQEFFKLTQQQQAAFEVCVQKRLITCMAASNNVIWFSFQVLCNIPRCTRDYLEIADRYRTVFLSGVPKLSADDTLHLVLLMHLVDVFYDRGIELIISAEVPLESLYVAGPMLDTFQRTLSRLQEMQADDFLKRRLAWTEHGI